MTGTKNATSKAPTTRKITLNGHARAALHVDTVTAESARAFYAEGLDSLARTAFIVYALQTGLAGPKQSVRDIVSTVGIKSAGTVSNLNRAGAILNRAGAGAGRIARDAVTVCQTRNSQATSALDTLKGAELCDAVTAMASESRKKDAERKRAARPAGPGVDKGKGKADPSKGADTSTNAGRMTVAVTMLNAVTRDAHDDSRAAILAACEKIAGLVAEIHAAYEPLISEIAESIPLVEAPAPAPVKRTRKAATKAA